jgi:hypothetical protein
MKATLEFNLDDPDDSMAHMRCVKSLDIGIVLFYITHNLRQETEDRRKPKTVNQAIEYIFNRIVEVCDDYNININELPR